jgi:acetyl esterase/lipase
LFLLRGSGKLEVRKRTKAAAASSLAPDTPIVGTNAPASRFGRMEIDPRTLFDERDFIRARRLNHLLSWLPRFHTGRRWNARAANALFGIAGVLPSSARLSPDVDVRQITVDHLGRRLVMRLLIPKAPTKGIYLWFHGGAWVLGNARPTTG